MCVVAGNNQKGMTKEQMHAQVIKVLRRVAPIVEREKVMLILEPMNGRVDHPGHCLYGSEDAVKICRAVDSPMVKINWDLYHAHISEGDLCGHLKEGIDQLGYVQLADHPGRNEPGTGEIYYPRVMRQLKELGYTGYVGLELAQAHLRLGSRVTVIEAAQALGNADPELAELVLKRLQAEGLEIRQGASVERVSGGTRLIDVHVAEGGKMAVVQGTHLLIAAGRKPNVSGLNLEAAAVKYDFKPTPRPKDLDEKAMRPEPGEIVSKNDYELNQAVAFLKSRTLARAN